MSGEEKGARAGGGLLSRTVNSIRTQCSLATAFFLVVILSVFYIGGRIVLVHLVRDTEEQVKSVGMDVSRLAYKNAERAKEANASAAGRIAREIAAGRSAREALDAIGDARVTLAAVYNPDGRPSTAAVRGEDGAAEDLLPEETGKYSGCIAGWMDSQDEDAPSVGIMQVRGAAHYISITRLPGGNALATGSKFSPHEFSAQLGGRNSAYTVAVRGTGGAPERSGARRMAAAQSAEEGGSYRAGFGFAPMLSHALDYYSGGFWEIGSKPFEAVFAVRDIAGDAVTKVAVSLPAEFSRITSSALGRFTFFVSVAGIFLVLPVFWVQGKVLLNPLTKMTDALNELARRRTDADCPRLEWEGKDEFSLLAGSVNAMLETIAERTASLRQLSERQKALIDGIPDGLSVFDRKGRLVSVKKQPEYVQPVPGFAAGSAMDPEIWGEEGVALFGRALERTFSLGKPSRVRLESRPSASGDGKRVFELRLAPMDGYFALAMTRDATREAREHELRLDAERKAADLSKRESLTQFAAGIAHDVNNVLAVIQSTMEAEIAARPDAGADTLARAEAVRNAVKRGSAMTKELMTFAGESRIALSRLKPSFIVQDIQMLVEGVIGRNVELSYDLADDAPDVDADPNQIWKVVFNIVKNASEAIGDRPGHILISTERYEMTSERAWAYRSDRPLEPGEGMVMRIADDGPGISPEFLPRMFDPYVSSKSVGRGLGLATVLSIVAAHGGGIRVTSRLDEGTTFHIYLPKSRLPETASRAGERISGSLPAEVLIVDNDEAILKTSSILLKTLGVSPVVARDRTGALDALRLRGDFDGVVLLDANLGGIDTVRLLGSFRIAAPKAKIVVFSGSREEDIQKMFSSSPYDGFLAKPYTLAELRSAIS